MSPKTTSQFETMREVSKEKILNAALSLFSTAGYFSTSVSRIATEAGISKGLMYNYFQSKEHLLRALIDKVIHIMDTNIPENIEQIDAVERIPTVLSNIFQTVEKHEPFIRMMTSLAFKTKKFEFMSQIMDQQYIHYIKLFTSFFEALGSSNPQAEARMLLATIDGVFFQYFVLGTIYPFEEIKQDLLEKYKF